MVSAPLSNPMTGLMGYPDEGLSKRINRTTVVGIILRNCVRPHGPHYFGPRFSQ
jgi:hypothetical protein